MLYALTLAGFVFLFVTFCHFFVERLTSPADKLGHSIKREMDAYISFVLSIPIDFWLYSFFPLNTWEILFGISVVWIIVFISWHYLANKVSSVHWWPYWVDNKVKKRLAMDFIVGILMAVLFLGWLHKYPILADPEDASMDFVMRVNQCGQESTVCTFPDKNNIPPKIVLLNIDDESYTKLGESPLTPRNYIQNLIESAVQDEARLIVVDISLSQKTDGLNYPDKQLHPDDQALVKYLADYETNCSGKKCPPIILARDFHQPTGSDDSFYIHKLPVPKIRPSFLEEAVKTSPHIQWASPTFMISEFDGKWRRQWLWQPTCEEGKQKFIPSIGLLTAYLISNGNQGYDKVALENALKNLDEITLKNIDPDFDFVGKACADAAYYEPKSLSTSIVLPGGVKIDKGELFGGGINQRIMFVLPWQNPPQGIGQVLAITGFMVAKFGSEKDRRILSILSASRYLSPNPLFAGFAGTAKSELKDSIVIIGNTHIDAGDMHETPLGQMPGMLIIANAIYSLLLNNGQIKPITWGKIFIEAVLILAIISLVFVIVELLGDLLGGSRSFLIFVIVTVIATGLIWWFSTKGSAYLLRNDGVWIDFSLPLVAIFFHHIVAKLYEIEQEAREKTEEAREKTGEVKKKAEEVKTVEKQWQTCQGELQTCKNNLHQCQQDKQQLLLGLETANTKKSVKGVS